MSTIPIIDISPIVGNDSKPSSQDFKRVSSQIDDACRTIGFFYIKGHGIDENYMKDALKLVDELFDIPKEEKEKVSIRKSHNHRGYSGFGEENVDDVSNQVDMKECFDLSLDLDSNDEDVKKGTPFYGPNQWPEPLKGEWKDKVNRHFDLMINLGRKLIRAFTPSLGLPIDHFDEMYRKPLAALRFLRYPPSSDFPNENDEVRVGCGAHTDYGFLTILQQDGVGGLQVRNVDGEWIDAIPIPNTFIVNLGDLMSKATCGKYKATPHRVLENKASVPRHSIPLFFDPHYNTLVKIVPSCISR